MKSQECFYNMACNEQGEHGQWGCDSCTPHPLPTFYGIRHVMHMYTFEGPSRINLEYSGGAIITKFLNYVKKYER